MSTIHLARARELISQRRAEPAISELQQHLALSPEDPTGHALMGLAFSQRGDQKEALKWAERAVGLAPDSGFSHYVRAVVLHAGDRDKEAEASVLESIRLEPFRADYYSLAGQIRSSRSDWKGAMEMAVAGLAVDPGHVGCANVRAWALMRQGQKDHAVSVIDSALADDPENAYTHTNRGWILLGQGKREEALTHFREALRINPNLDSARQGVLEALRTKYIVYRGLYAFYNWMAKFSPNVRRGIMIGAWVIAQVVSAGANSIPALAIVAVPLILLYAAFAFLTWTGRATFDLLLRFHPLGRMALNRRQIVASNWVGLCLVSCAIALGLVFAPGSNGSADIMAILCFLLIALPASQIGRRKTDYRTTVIACSAVYGTTVLALILGNAIHSEPRWLNGWFITTLWGLVAYTWISGMRS